MIRSLRRLAIFMSLASALAAQSYNAHVINVSGHESENIIQVEKANQMLMVSRSFGLKQLSTVKSFKVTTGRIKGDKNVEGDMRTPEGIYYVKYDIPGEKLLPKYGPLAMVLDYPNTVDKLNEKNGSNIWIHGRDVEIKDLQTEGCISLDNESTLQLRTFITHHLTPVIILDTVRYYTAAELDKEKRFWGSKIEVWRKYWEAGDIRRYMELYSPDFVDQSGRSKEDYRLYKKKLEEKYLWKQISLSDIIIYRSVHEIHAHFKQTYESPVFTGTGRKILKFIENENHEWLIIDEIYNDTEPRHYAEADLKFFLRQWKVAWESQDIEKYEKFYSPNFYNGKQNFIQYLDYKKELFAEGNKLTIKVSDINVSNVSEDLWKITFKQDYKADDYHDRGSKTLTVKEINKVYFIINETWTAL